MKCDTCGREVEGFMFSQHFAACSGLSQTSSQPSRRIPQNTQEGTKQRTSPSPQNALYARTLAATCIPQDSGMTLREVHAVRSSVYELRFGKTMSVVDEWAFVYADHAGKVADIRVTTADGKVWEKLPDDKDGINFSTHSDIGLPIIDWKVSNSQALMTRMQHDGVDATAEFLSLDLAMEHLDGTWVPVWTILIRRFGGGPPAAAVRADTGTLVFRKKPPDSHQFTSHTTGS